VIQLALGQLLIWAAVSTSWKPDDALRLSSAVLPRVSPGVVVNVASVLEWIVGVSLLSGVSKRLVLGVFIVMVASFSAGLFLAKHHGFRGSCGCLGLGGTVESALVRNGVLLVFALVSFSAPLLGSDTVSEE
jgi:hypothetical protein